MKSRLQQMREAYGLSVAELSELSDISIGAIRNIENVAVPHRTNVGVALALADALDCDLHDLFDPFEVSHLGRPPHTGRPIERSESVQYAPCPECFILVPIDVGCEECGTAVLPVPR